MKPDTQKKLQEHLKAIAEILYQEAEAEELETLEHRFSNSLLSINTY